jgi:hypothetical protein
VEAEFRFPDVFSSTAHAIRRNSDHGMPTDTVFRGHTNGHTPLPDGDTGSALAVPHLDHVYARGGSDGRCATPCRGGHLWSRVRGASLVSRMERSKASRATSRATSPLQPRENRRYCRIALSRAQQPELAWKGTLGIGLL